MYSIGIYQPDSTRPRAYSLPRGCVLSSACTRPSNQTLLPGPKGAGTLLESQLFEEVIVLKVVSSDPDVLGGTPVFVGTRVPVAVLFENLADGMTLDEILDAYPTVTREAALAALHEAEGSLAREQAAA